MQPDGWLLLGVMRVTPRLGMVRPDRSLPTPNISREDTMLHTPTGAPTGTSPRVSEAAAPLGQEGAVSPVAESTTDAVGVANPRRIRI